ncbi:MAG: hypothetical protein KY455_01845 [Euryarchaeota archaeon]|nr:hypothetical protein [Euryarchaeota archaeon]
MSPAPLRLGLLVLLMMTGSVLAGCLAEDTPRSDDEDVTAPEPKTARSTWFFAEGWGLDEAEPVGDTKRAPLGDFYSKWAQGGPFPEWVSAPLPDPLLVTGTVRLEFFVTTDSVVTSTPGVFPDFVLYFGTSESVMADFSPRAIQPVADQDFSIVKTGDAVRVLVEMTLPPGGITVPAGSGLRVITAPVMLETDVNDLIVLYGSTHYPSHVAFDATPLAPTLALSDTSDPRTYGESYTLLAGSIFHGQEIDGVTIQNLTVDVHDNDTTFLADLRFTGMTPFPDMDLYVYAPNGTLVARSVTPGPHESVHLYAENLAAVGPGTWTVKVVNYVTPRSTFDLSVTVS